jgi:hypothetical protein
VRLKPNLPGGTIVTNQAVVYFPTVPEETPTSVLVNMVQPVVAEPQTITTTYATPASVTLTGREVSDRPLTYRVVEGPFYGTLVGEAPNVIYTPMEDYAGPDRFSFVANNAVMDSRPAQIYINITPDGDIKPPTILWTEPVANEVVSPTIIPAVSDDIGPLYAPRIVIGFSEPLDPTTVHSGTVTLSGDITLGVVYDQATHRIYAFPRLPLQAQQSYTVTVHVGITDLAGNSLGTEYVWSFSTTTGAEQPHGSVYLPLVLRP